MAQWCKQRSESAWEGGEAVKFLNVRGFEPRRRSQVVRSGKSAVLVKQPGLDRFSLGFKPCKVTWA